MKRKILIISLAVSLRIGLAVCLIIMHWAVLAPLLKNQIRDLSRTYIFYNVEKRQEELSGLIGRYVGKDKDVFIHLYREDETVIPYKKMHDKEISNVFKDFHLMSIRYDENGNIIFHVYPYVGLFINGYDNGFYYSAEDEPIGKGEEIGDLEFEYHSLGLHRWYKTEQLLDHWWYFEEILTIE